MKEKKIGFTVTEGDYQVWKHISNDLIQKKIFRNKTEIFESFILFLQRAEMQKIRDLKITTMIV